MRIFTSSRDTGLLVWYTIFDRLNGGISWDQCFPEAARSMVLQGADILFCPTAIGSDP